MKITKKPGILFLAAVSLCLLTSCSKINQRFDDMNHRFDGIDQRLDQLENTTVASVRTQVQNIQNSLPGIEQTIYDLNNYVVLLKAENVIELSNSITNMEQYIASLQTQMTEIKNHTQLILQQENTSNELWADLTIQTLTLNQSFQNLLSLTRMEINNVTRIISDLNLTVNQKILDFNVSITALINQTEVSIMKWVNERFTAYYTIAEANALVRNLIIENNTEISESIDAILVQIDETNQKINSFYETLIHEAITYYDGNISGTLMQKLEKVVIDLNFSIESIITKITEIENRIIAIDNSINTVNQQITAINVSIEEMVVLQKQITQYITVLQEEGDTYNTQIILLQQIYSELSVKIEELNVYVAKIANDFDISISETKNWVSVTFATIEQYNVISTTIINIQAMVAVIQTSIETINQTIVNINTDITNIQNIVNISIQNIDNSTREWVNKKMVEYLTIKDAEGLFSMLKAELEKEILDLKFNLGSLKDFEDNSLSIRIQELEQAFVAIRKELYTEITYLVEEAITNHNGDVAETLAFLWAEVESMEAEWSGIKASMMKQLDTLSADIDDTLVKLHHIVQDYISDLCNTIQGLVHVPTCSDGSVTIYPRQCTLLFEVTPSSVTYDIASLMKGFSFDVLNVRTRAGSSNHSLTHLDITKLSADGDYLAVTVDFSSLGDDVFSGSQPIMGRLKFEYGSASVASKYFALTPSGSPTVTPEYVDLGLSVKWASFNVGATKPEEYGDYFAWGEVEEMTGPVSTDDNKASRIAVLDPTTYLDIENDVAHVKWGDDWRIPTKAELTELIENCTSEWTTMNGVYGRKFTSRINGRSIFLPAGGSCKDKGISIGGTDDEKYILSEMGTCGYYWSSVEYSGVPSLSYALYFNSDELRTRGYSKDSPTVRRYPGYTVRPVYGERVKVSGVTLDKTSLSLIPGESYHLVATLTPAIAPDRRLAWFSNDTDVATVDNNGLVTAVGSGSTTIELEALDGGSKATCIVTVATMPVNP